MERFEKNKRVTPRPDPFGIKMLAVEAAKARPTIGPDYIVN